MCTGAPVHHVQTVWNESQAREEDAASKMGRPSWVGGRRYVSSYVGYFRKRAPDVVRDAIACVVRVSRALGALVWGAVLAGTRN